MSYTMESRICGDTGMVEIRNYRWSIPLDEVLCDEHPIFGLSLSPVPSGSMARFQDDPACRDLRPVGRMLYRPASVPIRCVNNGGQQRLVMCTLRPEQLAGSAAADLVHHLDGARPDLDMRNPAMTETLRRLAAEVSRPGFASLALMEALITALLVDFLRTSRAPPEAPAMIRGGLAPWQLRKIDEALHGLEGQAPSVLTLAGLIGVTPRHLLRAFRASMGTSVIAHIVRVRLERACTLLSSTTLPVKQVAARCGFDSAGGFASAFRKEVGVSPKDYRARTRN